MKKGFSLQILVAGIKALNAGCGRVVVVEGWSMCGVVQYMPPLVTITIITLLCLDLFSDYPTAEALNVDLAPCSGDGRPARVLTALFTLVFRRQKERRRRAMHTRNGWGAE